MVQAIRRYTAAFMFMEVAPSQRHVLLVRKNRPSWQAGLLNGIGGEFEGDENTEECVRREFREETGFDFSGWDYFCHEIGPGYEVDFYRMTFSERTLYEDLKFRDRNVNDSGEPLEWHEVPVRDPCIGNLNWLIPLALDPRPIVSRVITAGDIRGIRTW